MQRNDFLLTEKIHESILKHSDIKDVITDIQIVFPELSNNVIGYSDDFDYYFAIIPELLNIINSNNEIPFKKVFEQSNFKLKMSLESSLEGDKTDIIENIVINLKYSLLVGLLHQIKNNHIYKIKSVNEYLPIIIDKFVDFANFHKLPFKNIFEDIKVS